MREDNLNKLGFEGDPHVLPVIKKLAKKNKVGASPTSTNIDQHQTCDIAPRVPVRQARLDAPLDPLRTRLTSLQMFCVRI